MSHWLVLAWSYRPWLKNWLLQASTHVIPCLCGGYEVEVTMEAGSGCGAWLDKTWQPSLANERFPCREGESNSIKLFGLTYCNRQRNTLLPFISAYGQRNIDCWKSQHATTSSIFVFYCSEIVYHSLTQNEQHCEIVLQTYAMNNIYITLHIYYFCDFCQCSVGSWVWILQGDVQGLQQECSLRPGALGHAGPMCACQIAWSPENGGRWRLT